MPTKTEQADLLMALFGRNGESPVAVVAPSTPSDCFEIAFEAVRIAVKYRTPVIILSDGYLANGSEPWRIPEVAGLPRLRDGNLPANLARALRATSPPPRATLLNVSASCAV